MPCQSAMSVTCAASCRYPLSPRHVNARHLVIAQPFCSVSLSGQFSVPVVGRAGPCPWMASRPASQSSSQPVSQSVSHSVRQSASPSANQSANQSSSQSVRHSLTQSLTQSITHSLTHSLAQSLSHSVQSVQSVGRSSNNNISSIKS